MTIQPTSQSFSQTARTLVWLLAIAVLLAAPVRGQGFGDLFGSGGLEGGFDDPTADPVTLTAQFTPKNVDRPAVLMLTADIANGYNIYSLTQGPGGPTPTTIQLAPSQLYNVIGSFSSLPISKAQYDAEVFKMEVEKHYKQVTWFVPIELAKGVDANSLEISGRVEMLACKTSCIPVELDFTAKLGQGVPIGPLDFQQPVVETPRDVPKALTTPPGPDATPFDLSAIQLGSVEASQGSLLKYLLLAFVGGLILNLMPCVLPVIGLKVMSFAEQAGHSRVQAFKLNLWYSLGILSVFLVLAGLAISAGVSWGQQFGNEAFNIVMAVVVFAMALSMLGVWEIPIPGFIGSGKAQEAASQEGVTGAFLKGVITTLLATPCTGPFMGGALGWAVKQPPTSTLAVFTVLGIGMASPYLMIGAFPKLVRFLPKPGAWMETFKQLMGFVLLGTVLFLIAILPSTYLLPTLVMLLCVGLACWVYSLTPYTASGSEKSQTYALCSAIVAGSAVVAFGWLYPLLNAEPDKSWQDFSLARLQQVTVEEGKTVLVDFSADWCWNCKALEAAVLHTETVEHAVKSNNIVTMYADFTHTPPEIKQTLSALGANGVPVIAVFPGNDPYRPIVFRDGYTQDGLVAAIESATGRSTDSVATARRPQHFSHPSGGR